MVIATAVVAVARREAEDRNYVRQALTLERALNWMYAGGRISEALAVAMFERKVSVAYEQVGVDIVITLKVNAGPTGPMPNDILT